MVRSKSRSSRLNRRHSSRLIMQALEPRVLLNGYTFVLSGSGSPTANGTYLTKIFKGIQPLSNSNVSNHILAQGDTLVLPSSLVYDVGVLTLNIPNLDLAANVIVSRPERSAELSLRSPAEILATPRKRS